jgi:hypothetical protein
MFKLSFYNINKTDKIRLCILIKAIQFLISIFAVIIILSKID